MARFLHQFDTFTFRRNRVALLALSWIIGLGFGGLTFRYDMDHLVSQMPSVLSSRSSIVGLASSALLPFLFSVFAVYFSRPWVLMIICFCKAFLYAYISCGVYQSFGSASWLIHWLLLFVDTLSIPVLFLYWLRHLSGCRRFRLRTTAVYLTAFAGITALGYYLVSPLIGALTF